MAECCDKELTKVEVVSVYLKLFKYKIQRSLIKLLLHNRLKCFTTNHCLCFKPIFRTSQLLRTKIIKQSYNKIIRFSKTFLFD